MVGVSGYQLCFFSAVRLTGVAVGTVVAIGSGPVLTGLISRLTGGGPLTVRWMVATAGAVGGCALLVASGRAAGVSLAGVGLALAGRALLRGVRGRRGAHDQPREPGSAS